MSARSSKIKQKCRDCTERIRNERGIFICPHIHCIFGENDWELWREVGGATLFDPVEVRNDK